MINNEEPKKDKMKSIICIFSGHKWRLTATTNRREDTYVCERCGDIMRIQKW